MEVMTEKGGRQDVGSLGCPEGAKRGVGKQGSCGDVLFFVLATRLIR